jgi:hypothetical protein
MVVYTGPTSDSGDEEDEEFEFEFDNDDDDEDEDEDDEDDDEDEDEDEDEMVTTNLVTPQPYQINIISHDNALYRSSYYYHDMDDTGYRTTFNENNIPIVNDDIMIDLYEQRRLFSQYDADYATCIDNIHQRRVFLGRPVHP